MKSKIIFALTLLAILSTSVSALAGSNNELTVLAINYGVDGFAQMKEGAVIEKNGRLIGGMFRFLPGRFGLGFSLFQGFHDKNLEEYGILKEGDKVDHKFIGGYTFDFTMRVEEASFAIPYFFLSVGKAQESIRIITADTTDDDYEDEQNSIAYGMGFGAFTVPTKSRGFVFGGEIRYLMLPNFNNASGLGQAYLSLGYLFL